MKIKRQNFLHYNMSFVGGVFGGFAVCRLGEIFGNSQTLNLIAIVGSVFEGDVTAIILRVIGALLYTAGLALSVFVPKLRRLRADVLSVVISAVCIAIILVMPNDVSPIITLYPIFFAMSYQWTQFCEVEGYVSASIFSTNNYRQFIVSGLEYLVNKESEKKVKARAFGFTLLWFHLGVAFVCLFGLFMGRYSLAAGIIPLALSAAVMLTTTSPCPPASRQSCGSRR